MEKKYKLKMSETFIKMSAILVIVRLWKTGDEKVFFSRIFAILYFSSCILSIFVQACVADNNDESVFLLMTTLIGIAQIYRLYFINWKQQKIVDLMYASSASSTDDYEMFCLVNRKLTYFTIFAKGFLSTTFSLFIFTTFTPLVKKKLLFNIAFPLDYKTNESAFYVATAFVASSFLLSVTCCLGTSMIWYIMLNFAFKFELLGNEFKNLGVARAEKQDTFTNRQAKSTLYLRHLIEIIKSLESIQNLLEEFISTFSGLFLLQVVTSSLCICGAVYNLAFSSHDDLIKDGFYFVVIIYCFCDTFTVMYLGNEKKLCSDRLSYCVFESNWMKQIQFSKNDILIVVERLKKPQQLLVGKLFPLTLATFSIIVNRVYSLFNVLQNMRK